MAVQIPFPQDADFPPKRPDSRYDQVIEHLFQVLPASSVNEIIERLNKRGLNVTEGTMRGALKHLRKNADVYQWTVPHVNTSRISEMKYFAILLEKDKTFHSDPGCRRSLTEGTKTIVSRIATESKNQSVMLQAAAQATYLSRPIREELTEMADECTSLHKKARRVLRYLKSNNG